MINVRWGNRLEEMAAEMFAEMAEERCRTPAEALGRRQCVIVPNRIVQHWLRHEFLFRRGPPRVLAGCDFPLVNVFVNDLLFRLTAPAAARRDPAAHPFGREALVWRIHAVLEALEEAPLRDEPRLEPLRDHLRPAPGDDPRRLERRRFRLAARLVSLFDEDTVDRPEMLIAGERGRDEGVGPDLAWQPFLWRALTAGELAGETYLASFRRIADDLATACGAAAEHRRLRLFGASLMPCVYLHFFEKLGARLPVDFFVFNPCREAWFDIPPRAARQASVIQGRLDREEDDSGAGNVFLGLQGRGSREFLIELLDRTEGQAEAGGRFVSPGRETLLHALQESLLANEPAAPGALRFAEASLPPARRSVQIHVCHSPQREVEVLRDHLLRWFTEEPGLQPRQVQVQVADMALFAPYIHAVFAAADRHAADAIPYAVADRVTAGESSAAMAFDRLLTLAEGRFTAPEIFDLLHVEAVREAFGLGAAEIEALQRQVRDAGVRWGRSRAHREEAVGVDFDDYTTWRRGLDRLLLGYAYGSDGDDSWPDGLPLPCDRVEGEDAVALGRFARCVAELEDFADACAGRRPPAEWAGILEQALATFFAATDATYRDVALLRSAVAALRVGAEAARCDRAVGVAVVRDFLAARLRDVLGGDDLGANAVVFSALRPGSSLPRRIVCLLGMSDGLFPRSDSRPAYDLLRRERRFGDRSPRQEDRLAFLEAVASARERLYVSYTGYTLEENLPSPPSVLVAELREALDRAAGLPAGLPDSRRACRPVLHRLRGYAPDYFAPGAGASDEKPLFSYSACDCEIARALLARATAVTAGAGGKEGGSPGKRSPPPGPVPETIELEKLSGFLPHPVRGFYRDVLGAFLETGREAAALDDQETFTPDALAAFRIGEEIVAALTAETAGDARRVRRRLLEEGLLPLGARGAEWFDSLWRQIESWLGQEVPATGIALKEALRRRRAAPARRHVLTTVGGLRIAGRTAAAATAETACLIEARYVGDTTRHRLAVWLRHLFACAAGLSAPRLAVWRPEKDAGLRLAVLRLEPLAAAEALGRLEEMMSLYLAGQEAPLPFAMKTSAAFVRAWRKAAGEEQPAASWAVAMAEARAEWHRHAPAQGEPPERDDPYLRAAFGTEGPFADERRFAATALAILPAEIAGN